MAPGPPPPVAPDHAGAVLGRRTIPRRLPARAATPHHEHEHPRVDRHQRGLLLQRGGDPLAARVHGRGSDALLRGLRAAHDLPGARALARGARPRRHLGGDPTSRRAPAPHRASGRARRRARRADRRDRARRPAARPPGRADRGGRLGRRGRLQRRRVDADRREPAGRERPRRPGRRRLHQPHRDVHLPGHPRGTRHRAGPDRATGRGRPGLEGADPAARRPGGVRVRSSSTRSPTRSACSSSPARAPSGWRRPPR